MHLRPRLDVGVWLLAAILLCCAPAFAENEADEVYESASDALESMQQETRPETGGETAQEVISQFFPEVDEDEGTYPASEFVDHGFLLRRQGPAKGHYSGQLFAKYSQDKISDVEKWEKELELNLGYKDFDAYFRVGDISAFAYQKDPFRWEKGQVRYKYKDSRVTVGSFGALFGRGLALNMFEDRGLDFDNEAEGIKIEQEIKGGQLTALYGYRKLRDELTRTRVAAARFSAPINDELEFGVHTVDIKLPDNNSTAETMLLTDWELMGGDITWRPGHFRLYGEVVGLERPILEEGQGFNKRGEDGLGYYYNVAYSVPGFSIDVEHKNYRRLTTPFNVLPPVRRWNEAATASPDADKGYGVGLNWSPADDGSLFSAHYAQEQKYAPYSELLMSYGGPTASSFHYILENWQINNLNEKHQYNRATLSQTLNEDWSSSLLLEHERRNLGFKKPFNDWTFEPEIAYQSKFNLIYTYEFSGEERVTPDQRKEWKLWEIKYKPDGDQEFNLVLGSRQAGFVCSGGVCRPEPEFSGVRLDYLLRF